MNDVQHAVRTLSRRPAFTTVVVLTLGLGIGLTAAMFNFADALLLRPPAGLADADRVVIISEGRAPTPPLPGSAPPSGGPLRTATSAPHFFAWRERQQAFSHVSASWSYVGEMIAAGRERAELVHGLGASADFFETLGVPLLLGRGFRLDEERAGSAPVVILTHRYWQSRFGGDVLGTPLRLNDATHAIVGVLPPHPFFDRQRADIWLPLALVADDIHLNNDFLQVYGRLKPGVTPTQAHLDLNRVHDGLKREGRTARPDVVAQIHPFRDTIVGAEMHRMLRLLIGAVAFVLLITFSNVAHLMTAHYARTAKDVAIRLALGAGRSRLARQFVAESLLLSGLGGVAGLGAAFWLVRTLVHLMPPSALPPEAVVAVDLRVVLFTAALSIASGLLFGLLPVWRASRGGVTMADLKTRGDTGESTDARGRLARHALLVAEVALTVMLVIGSAMLFRNLVQLLRIDPGFRTAGTIALSVRLDPARYTSAAHLLAYQDAMLTRLRSVPGVANAAMASVVPLTQRNMATRIARPEIAGSRAGAGVRYVSPDYFATMGIALRRGRPISAQDTAAALPVIVINDTLAKFFWPDEDPIGRQLYFHERTATIVGIVSSVRHQRLTANPISEFYISFAQAKPDMTLGSVTFVVRASGEATVQTGASLAALMGALRTTAAAVDKDAPLASLRTIDDFIADAVAEPRFTSSLFALFGVLSLVLAAIGIYGVLSYVVSARTREFGIRLALGAQRRDVFRLVLAQGLAVTSIGVAIGAAGGYAITRLLANALFGVTGHDPITYVATTAVVMTIALLACWTPARRATRADPMVVLRGDG